jgi:hypothetical protein
MNKRTLTLLSGIMTLWLAYYVIRAYQYVYYSPPKYPRSRIAALSSLNGESLLALGEKLPLSVVTEYELQLIPSVSEVTARKILERKEMLLKLARTLQNDKNSREKPLEQIHGIGPKKAARIGEYLLIE